nr:MAG TPA: hypothetical protein [Caudoviricetes sp.]
MFSIFFYFHKSADHIIHHAKIGLGVPHFGTLVPIPFQE